MKAVVVKEHLLQGTELSVGRSAACCKAGLLATFLGQCAFVQTVEPVFEEGANRSVVEVERGFLVVFYVSVIISTFGFDEHHHPL